MRPTTLDAYNLFHRGTLALSEVERNGIRVDLDYLDTYIAETEDKIKQLEKELRQDEIFKVWRKRFGLKANLDSRYQLGTVIFEILGHKRSLVSEDKNNESAFENVKIPFIKTYFHRAGLVKTLTTYLLNIKRECDSHGIAHCNYNLNLAISYRSTADKFNFQNLPVRDLEMAETIRRSFIPFEPDDQIGEVDFSGIEVKVACCYTKDPVLIRYVKDKTTDMHRDMAAECFMLHPDHVDKVTRYCAKNMFVFPEFYGSYYKDCSKHLWEAIGKFNLGTGNDNLYAHLKQKGIKSLGLCKRGEEPVKKTFEYHIQQVEKDFWGRRFKVYTEWKKRWWNQYLQNCGFTTFTGFQYYGTPLNRKQAINYPIQGSAFHCLLWCLIEFMDELKRYRMKSRVIGQIHDSIVGNIKRKERRQYFELAHEIMTERLPKHYQWINVPLEVEAEVAPPGKSWFDKKGVKI